MSVGWQGQKTQLVPLEHERHFENCVRWLNDPELTQWTLGGDFPLTRAAEEEFFARVTRATEAPTDLVLAIETLDEEPEHIGVVGLHAISYRHGTATTGTLIGRRSLWGRGYGSDAIAVRSRYAFETLGLRLLLTEVMAENTASLRALQKNGYREVGRVPQRYWKRGALRDVVLLALPRTDWPAAALENPHG